MQFVDTLAQKVCKILSKSLKINQKLILNHITKRKRSTKIKRRNHHQKSPKNISQNRKKEKGIVQIKVEGNTEVREKASSVVVKGGLGGWFTHPTWGNGAS